MDGAPEVTRCFGTFQPKYATFLISVFGLASGITGLTGVVMYGLIEKALMRYLAGHDVKMDDTLRKVVLLTIGLTSLLMTSANALLFLGATTKSRGSLASGIWILFATCVFLILGAMAAPLSCFFFSSVCIVQKVSTSVTVLAAIVLTIFLEIWLYFLVVANNYLNQL